MTDTVKIHPNISSRCTGFVAGTESSTCRLSRALSPILGLKRRKGAGAKREGCLASSIALEGAGNCCKSVNPEEENSGYKLDLEAYDSCQTGDRLNSNQVRREL